MNNGPLVALVMTGAISGPFNQAERDRPVPPMLPVGKHVYRPAMCGRLHIPVSHHRQMI
jgi:hypothetical protein